MGVRYLDCVYRLTDLGSMFCCVIMENAVKNYLLAVLTAITAAAIMVACGAAPVAIQPTKVVEAKAQPQGEESVDWTALKKSGPNYWSLSTSKAFKAVEFGCTLKWGPMERGCIVVIDKKGEGFVHDGVTGPFGVVVPRETGVTITSAKSLYIPAKDQTYSFVIIDERGPFLAQQFSSSDPQWDDKLLTEFFVTQMGGEVSTIWREGVSDLNNN